MSLIYTEAKPQSLISTKNTATDTLPPASLIAALGSVEAALKSEPDDFSPQPEWKQTSPSPGAAEYTVETEAIPASLKALPNWIDWKRELNEKGKPTKVPYVPGSSNKAATDNPSSWKSFEDAVKSLTNDRGLGFVLPPGDMFFIDLDHVRNSDTGEVDPWAARIVAQVDSYTEISPSGTGLHILGRVKGSIPPEGLKKGAIELYTRGRYATMTGNHYASTPPDLQEVDVSWVYRLIQGGVFNFTESSKYTQLFKNIGEQWKSLEYPSRSEADLALSSMFTKKLGNKFDDIDHAFRLSGLMREKWDSKRKGSTYGRDTILKVISKDTSPFSGDDDIGNANRLVARHESDIRYCHTTNKWLIWDGARFAIDKSGEIKRRAIETITSTYREVVNGTHAPDIPSVAWAKASKSRGRINASIDLAQSDKRISVTHDALDSNQWLFNCKNGTIDLRTGKLREHRREDLITQLAPIEFDPGATCPLWDKFLPRIMAGNFELINFLQRAIGYSLTGSTEEQVLFIQHGSGRNGKTVFSEATNAMFGDYGTTADARLLLTARNDGPRTDVARLEGARLILTSETPAGGNLDQALVKLLTGGDKIAARQLYSAEKEYYPTGKIWLRTNKKPQIHGCDPAIWKRIRLIPFTVTIPDAEQDKKLLEKLRFELPGILAWAVRGCLEWQKIGLAAPAEVTGATMEYEQESDVLREFLEDCCDVDQKNKGLVVPCADLYKAYQCYCEEKGDKAKDVPGSGLFGKMLTERGFGKIKSLDRRKHRGPEVQLVLSTQVLYLIVVILQANYRK